MGDVEKRSRPVLELIRRERCSLCDMAAQMLRDLAVTPLVTRYVEDDPALESAFGWYVPVVRRADGQELRWPFDPVRLRAFLSV